MGAEAACVLTVGRKRYDGKALLETGEIIFRSPAFRLKVPFAEIQSVEAQKDALVIRHAGGTATFVVGAAAARWADKIRNPRSLIDKLGVKPEHRVVVLNVDDAEFARQLAERAPDVSTRLREESDVIFLGAESLEALARLAALREAIKRDGMIWAITPKGKGGIKDTDVMAAGEAAGLVDVKVAAFSATHSAAKFVIPKAQR